MNWKLSVILLTLSVIACGMSVPTQQPETKAVLVNAPELSPAPVPTLEKSKACGNWNVRESADPHSASRGIVLSGGVVTLTGVTATAPAPDYGVWVQVVDRDGGKGWMNARALCEVEK